MPRASATETRELRKAPLACLPGPITRTVYNYLYIRQHEWSNSVGPEDTDALRR